MRNPLENRQDVKDYLELQEEIRKAKTFYAYVRKYVKLPNKDLTEMNRILDADDFFGYNKVLD